MAHFLSLPLVEQNDPPFITWHWEDPDLRALSDWTIVVTAEGDDSNEEIRDVYHVHRIILAVSSDYFRALFRQPMETEESRSRTSTFTLHPLARAAFPVFLDYIYSIPDGIKSVEASNVIALRHLAQYFGAATVSKHVTKLLLKDIRNSKNRALYIAEASAFHDDEITSAIQKQVEVQEMLSIATDGFFQHLLRNLDTKSNDNNEDKFNLKGWKMFMAELPMGCNVYFATRYAQTFPAVNVLGAGVLSANGVYNLVGTRDGVGCYSNGAFFLQRANGKSWSICLGHLYSEMVFEDGEPHWNNVFVFYTAEKESTHPPSYGWDDAQDEYNEEIKLSILPSPRIVQLEPGE